MRFYAKSILSTAAAIALILTLAIPSKSKAEDFGELTQLIAEALSQITGLETNIQGFITTIKDFYNNPNLSGGIDIGGFLEETITSFDSFDLSDPNLGSYGDCLSDPKSCICGYASFVCRTLPAKSALSAGEDPLVGLAGTMSKIRDFPGIGDEHPVIKHFLNFAQAMTDAQKAADAQKKFSNKSVKLAAKVKALKIKVRAGEVPVSKLQKAKAKLKKTKSALHQVQDAIGLNVVNDPVGHELDKLRDSLLELQVSN